MGHLSPPERFTLLKIAEAATPRGAHIGLPDGDTIDAVERLLGRFGDSGIDGYRALVRALDLAAVPLTGQRLASLEPEAREAALVRLNANDKTFWFVRAVTAPIKIVQSQANGLGEAIGAHDGRQLPLAREHHRWESQITDGRTLDSDETIEVDCVVVGTGAGGAPVAHALAARGHAVLMLEVGGHFTRQDFAGRPLDLQQKLYWNGGVTGTLGNLVIPVPLGRTVGGTTTVNSGTCYRTPEHTMRRWQLELGLHDLAPGSLDPYFESVERMLEVAPATTDTLGGCARVIARGCEALGYEHGPLSRNAPGCDAQAVCCFGCPTDAKRSTNISYVPAALQRGAMLTTHARVTKVIVEAGRAVGVVAKVGGENGSSRRLTVRAKTVVLACGSMSTPGLLLRQGLANSSGEVGKNLTIHPASYAWAAFDEEIDGFNEIPQGYAVEEFADQGIRFEGAFLPLSLAAGTMSHVGRKWTDLVERLDKLACFGFMLAEKSRGRVVLGPGGKPQMTYRLVDEDVRRIVRASGILARIYFAAGAEAVYPGMQIYDELTSLDDVARLENEGLGRVRAHHLDLTAYHPLGTCRMGSDPRRSVIGQTNETWDVPGLFVVDGSAVAGPLGVNPQITIMAISERAAQFVERRIEEGARPKPIELEGAVVGFEETMSGMCSLAPEEGGGTVEVSFTVKALGEAGIEQAVRARGGTLRLVGTIAIDGVCSERACEGTLVMKPLERKGTLVYDLFFDDDEGRPCTLHGEKHTGVLSVLSGMTTLHTELRREGALLGRGILTFALSDLAPWLSSWRLARNP